MNEHLAWLFARQRFVGLDRLGLERVRELLAHSGHPERSFRSFLIGGTNGKGSTAATLASSLQADGRRTALFTSPHLSFFTERFQVDGKPLPEETVAAALRKLRPAAERLEATFFEIVTALAFTVFAEAGVEIAVVEAGMGGRNDATNVLEPDLSIITNVSLDHTAVLGDTVEAIARDKAGLMRAGRPVLTGAGGSALEVLRAEAAALEADLITVGGAGAEVAVQLRAMTWAGIDLSVKSPYGDLTLHSPLLGQHQAANVGLAVAAAQRLGVAAASIEKGVAAARWPGRLELLSYRNRRVLLDGAHNPAAAQALRHTLEHLGVEQLSLIVGIGQDKDVDGVLTPLVDLASTVILTKATSSPRASAPEDLLEYAPGATVINDARAALEHAVTSSAEDDLLLIAGSLYLIGELRPYVLGERAEELERWQ